MELKFLEWQHDSGGRKTVADFADYLGVGQTTASAYMNGKRLPEGENIKKLSTKLGLEVYDVLGIPRPDPDLLYLTQNWGRFDSSFRKTLRVQAEKYAAQNKKKK